MKKKNTKIMASGMIFDLEAKAARPSASLMGMLERGKKMIIRNYAASIAYPSFPNFQRIFLPFMKALNRVVRFVAPYQKAISRKSHLKLSVFPFQSIIIHQNLLRQPVLSLHMSLKPPGSGGVAGRWKPHEPTNTGCGRRYGKRP